MTSTTITERQILTELAEGPASHQELCERQGLTWSELQPLIRSLRTKDKVAIRPDRRYQLKDSEPDDFCDFCSRNLPPSELATVYTAMDGIEQKERVCPDCEAEAREYEAPQDSP